MTGATPHASPDSPDRLAQWTAELQDAVTALFDRLDGTPFVETTWERSGGGGGRARQLVDGQVFEKAGVNRALVEGALPAEAAARLGAQAPAGVPLFFFATGVSVVAHPRSPMVPTVHLNVRYVELHDGDGVRRDAWYGGGADLTPMHPYPDDARHFHRALKHRCDLFDPAIYPKFKSWCDDYFRNAHRQHEARGVGGIFFDHLRAADAPFGLTPRRLHAFVDGVGRTLDSAYAPIVERRRDLPYTERDRALQLFRRGRYVEFNLLHDRGTQFGLQTGARTESVLMSLPPLAAWPVEQTPTPGSTEAQLAEMLVPQDWIADP